jgi:hypothetical protein
LALECLMQSNAPRFAGQLCSDFIGATTEIWGGGKRRPPNKCGGGVQLGPEDFGTKEGRLKNAPLKLSPEHG